jgi:hypothetical protein
MRLLFGYRAVLDPLWDDEQLAWTKRDITLAHANGDVPLEDKEEVIRVFVYVPDELTLDLNHHQIVTIELADYARLPVTFESSEFVCEIDGLHIGLCVLSDNDARL